jgi:glutamyl-tRNA synthetase
MARPDLGRIEKQSDRFERYQEAADDLRRKGSLYEVFETPTELDLKRKAFPEQVKPPVYDRAGLKLSATERGAARARREGTGASNLTRSVRVDGRYSRALMRRHHVRFRPGSDPRRWPDPHTFASSVDDVDMAVTHIVRGADHVTNTATQIQIMHAMGGTPPAFAHHSLLTGAQGEGLSKRLGTLSLRDLRAAGVAKEALLSLMARLGSSQPVELRMSLDEIAAGFDLSQFGAAPTKFDAEDLWPLTRERNQHLPFEAVKDRVLALGVPAGLAERFWKVASKNITKLDDLGHWWTLCRDGAEPIIADEDREFVAEAMSLLPPPPTLTRPGPNGQRR